MNQKKDSASERSTGARKPYRKPEIHHEKIFETQALVCGKIVATQAQCRTNRKIS